jgi:hypothetical protein
VRNPWRLAFSALASAWLVILWLALSASPDLTSDAHGYWLAAQPGVNPYDRAWSLQPDAYVYPPPFLQVIIPVATILDWPVFHAAWTALLMGGVIWLAGPLLAVVLLLPVRGWPVWESVIWGNVEVPMTIALILALRWPGSWSGILLTKVTPGIAALWHAGRREWRQLAIATGIPAGIALVSALLAPDLWRGWMELVGDTVFRQPYAAPIWMRLPLAAVTAILGGLSGRPFTVVAAVVVAHPAVWVNTLAIPMLWITATYRAGWSDRVMATARRLARSME